MTWSRASELSRAVACPASAHLPRGEDGASAAADWGTSVHAWAETGRWPADTAATRRRDAALRGAGLTREKLWPGGAHEVTYALATGSRLATRDVFGTRAEREAFTAGLGEEWLSGTADWVGDWFGEPWVEDLKTGKGHPIDFAGHRAGETPPDGGDPWDIWQLRLYAVAEALVTRPSGVWVSVLWWPRYPADSVPVRIGPRRADAAEIRGLTLPLLETARLNVIRSRAAPVADARSGDHCHFCRCKAVCPALQTQEDPWNET